MDLDNEKFNDTEIDREVDFNDSKATIVSEVKQESDLETFMDMFFNKVEKQRNLSRQVRNTRSQIQQLLEEHADDMQNLQAFDSDQEKSQTTSEVQRGNAVNSVPFPAIKTYVDFRQAEERVEEWQNELDDIEEDLRDIAPVAEEIAEEHDFEMPEIWEQKAKEEVMSDE